MLPYFLALTSSVAAAATSEALRRLHKATTRLGRGGTASFFAILAGSILICFAALRWRVGTDYVNYSRLYDVYQTDELHFLGEPGIRVLSRLAALIRDDYITMFAAASVLTVGLTVRTLYKHSSTFGLAILIYFLSTAYQGSFNGVRQYIACAIIFAGHRFILHQRFLPYLLVVLTAAMFHISALAAIFIYLVPRKRLKWRGIALLLACAVTVSTLYDQVAVLFELVTQDDISTSSYYRRAINPLRIAFAFAPVLIFWAFTKRPGLGQQGDFYFNLLLVNGAVFVAALNSAYVARFAIYTHIYMALAVPLILRALTPRDRVLVGSLLLLGFFTFWYIETTGTPSLATYRWVGERP